MTVGYKDIILSSSHNRFEYLTYLKKRFIKFIPLHWICLLVVLFPLLLNGERINMHILVSNVALLQSWIPIQDYYFSYNALSWYLSNTLFLSIIFPLIIILIGSQSRKTMNVLFALCLGIYIVLVAAIPQSLRHALLYINPLCRTFDFIIGIFLAFLVTKNKESHSFFHEKHKWIPDAAFVLSLLALVVVSSIIDEEYLPIAGIFWPLIAVMIVSLSLMQDSFLSKVFTSRFAQTLSQCTFSFYMIHTICRDYITRLMPSTTFMVRVTTIFIVTYIISQVVFFCIEKKTTKYLQLWLIKPAKKQPSTIAN